MPGPQLGGDTEWAVADVLARFPRLRSATSWADVFVVTPGVHVRVGA